MGYDIQKLEKQPSESRVYDIDFSANLAAGETISAVSSCTASPSGLTLGAASYTGTKVQIRISGGVTGTQYKVTAIVTTSAGNTLEGEGNLLVLER